MSLLPRLVPEWPLPPYTFVPGGSWPHPIRDPQGHSFGKTAEMLSPPGPDNWAACRTYLYGMDLFNRGYYWEAHEAWESLWHAAGRRGAVADFLKGLIKLAAAGVKVREGVPAGVRSHARRAGALFRQAGQTQGPCFLGLDLEALVRCADGWHEGADRLVAGQCQDVQCVGDVLLRPVEACA